MNILRRSFTLIELLVVIAIEVLGTWFSRMNPQWIMFSNDGTTTGGNGCVYAAPGSHLSEARSAHSGGCHFLFGDGTVKFVSEQVDQRVYGALFTIAGREIIDEDDF